MKDRELNADVLDMLNQAIYDNLGGTSFEDVDDFLPMQDIIHVSNGEPVIIEAFSDGTPESIDDIARVVAAEDGDDYDEYESPDKDVDVGIDYDNDGDFDDVVDLDDEF